MEISYEKPTAKEYIDLRERANMAGGRKSLDNSKKAIDGSIFIVSIRDKEKLVGMGRIVGDGGITYVVSDIMVDASYQGKGLGKRIMKEIDNYFNENADKDSYITLIAVKPADKLYSKFNFHYVEPKSSGMIRIV